MVIRIQRVLSRSGNHSFRYAPRGARGRVHDSPPSAKRRAAAASRSHQRCIRGHRHHPIREAGDIAMGHQVSGHAVLHRFAQPGICPTPAPVCRRPRPRRRDTPPFLGTGKTTAQARCNRCRFPPPTRSQESNRVTHPCSAASRSSLGRSSPCPQMSSVMVGACRTRGGNRTVSQIPLLYNASIGPGTRTWGFSAARRCRVRSYVWESTPG